MEHVWTTYIIAAAILSPGFTKLLTSYEQEINADGLPSLSGRADEIIKVGRAGTEGEVFNIETSLIKGNHSLSRDFLSVTIDSNKFKPGRGWPQFIERMKMVEILAAALAPANLRLGGTNSDFLTFSPDGNEVDGPQESGKDMPGFIMSGEQWDNMTRFARNAGWDIIWDFNEFKRTNGVWDTSHAELFLNYSDARGVEIPVFQLGNEPQNYKSHFNFTISNDGLLQDYRILRTLLSKYPRYAKSQIYGPDQGLLVYKAGVGIRESFLKPDARGTVDTYTYHHYYRLHHNATKYTDPETMDTLKSLLTVAFDYAEKYPPPLPIRLTETSAATSEDEVADMSRGYVAGFLWLDKLGVTAQFGIRAVYRQTFISDSGLLNNTAFPNPDYFLSVLYKRLVEGPVLKATSQPTSPDLRVYSNCARTDVFGYPKGAVVFYFLNLRHNNVTLSLTQFQGHKLDLFLLTPGDDRGLTAKYVKLNGRRLVVTNSTLPSMPGLPHAGDVTVSAQSFGFIVAPYANAPACL